MKQTDMEKCLLIEIECKDKTIGRLWDEISKIVDEKSDLQRTSDWHEQMSQVLKRALLIACDGDTMKATKCIDRTITEPENK